MTDADFMQMAIQVAWEGLGEVQAIREASRQLKMIELAGSVIYSTCEPCPMCFTACLWAKLDRIVYACRIEDAEKAGIRRIPISSSRVKQFG